MIRRFVRGNPTALMNYFNSTMRLYMVIAFGIILMLLRVCVID